MSVSSRMLRKFRGDQDALTKNFEENSDADDTIFSPPPRANLNVNRYNLLNDETQSESEVKEDDDNETESVHRRISHDTRVSKRKKKKKKRQSLPASQKHSSEDLDEVERSVREVNAMLGQTAPGPAEEKIASAVERGLLTVERKNLNPKNELKRIFGSKTIQANEVPKGRGRKRCHINLWLVTFRDQWALLARGPNLSMVPTEKKDGAQYFKYEHSASYQAAERRFLACVESMDPDQLMLIANTYPFHVNTLIQLSEMCKMSEEISVAALFIERALFTLESGFHPLFNIAKGNCRLDYRHQENRALFIALFNHLTYVGQRACYRTALEFCKLLLSLDPVGDPLAIVLSIDFYAIRAGEYKWFIRLIEEVEDRRYLSQLPNISYSRAMATFYLGQIEKADQLLQDALIMFPGVLIPLLEKCSIAPDPRTSASSFFQDAIFKQSASLKLLHDLYVGRCYFLWKDPQIVQWLERNTSVVHDRVDKKDPLIEQYERKRSVRFEYRTPRAVQRHFLLSDIKDVNITEPGTTFSFDPLPPFDSINIYERPERTRMYDHFNTVSLFFRSMMPFFNERQQEEGGAAAVAPAVAAEGEPAQENDGAAGTDRASLHRSVADLLDAMRNLISNLQPLQESGNESTDESDSDGNDS